MMIVGFFLHAIVVQFFTHIELFPTPSTISRTAGLFCVKKISKK
jgi:hypothetical protein